MFKGLKLAGVGGLISASAALAQCPPPLTYEQQMANNGCSISFSPDWGGIVTSVCHDLAVGNGQKIVVNFSDGSQREGVRATDDQTSTVYADGKQIIDMRVWFI